MVNATYSSTCRPEVSSSTSGGFVHRRLLCLELNLIIELDGARHFEQTFQHYDAFRTAKLQSLGMTVGRFENEQVLLNMKIVRGQILGVIRALQELRP